MIVSFNLQKWLGISNKTIIIFIVSLALFMDAVDATIINTAIPAISHSLRVNPIDLKLALISYLLSLAVFIPISGWLGEKFGVKRVFIFALIIFSLSSFWCGYAHNLLNLVIARSCQGLGGALMIPLGRLIMLHTFERHELVDAMNHVIMVVSVGLMLGPLAGGVITDRLSWPWIFWVNIPVGILATLAALFWFKDTSPRRVRPFDFFGFFFYGGGIAGITFSLSRLSETTENVYNSFLILGIGILLLVNYFLLSRKKAHAIINIKLFTHRTFSVSIISNLFARLGFGGVPFLLPLLLQIGLGYSAESSGLLLVPIAFGVLFIKIFSLRLLRLIGFRRLLIINTILVGLSLWAFIIIDKNISAYVIACLTFIFGTLISMQFSGMNSLAYADIPKEDLSAATTLVSSAQQLAQSFGVASAALLLHHYSYPQHFQLTPAAFHLTFFAMGFITFAASLIFTRLKPNDGHQMLRAPSKEKMTIQ